MKLSTFVSSNGARLSLPTSLQQTAVKSFSYEGSTNWKRQISPRTECHRSGVLRRLILIAIEIPLSARNKAEFLTIYNYDLD
jgi:hypothetical protein